MIRIFFGIVRIKHQKEPQENPPSQCYAWEIGVRMKERVHACDAGAELKNKNRLVRKSEKDFTLRYI